MTAAVRPDRVMRRVEGADADQRGEDGQIRPTAATRQIRLPPWQHKVGACGQAWPPPRRHGTGRDSSTSMRRRSGRC
jgi:hypothetical protein